MEDVYRLRGTVDTAKLTECEGTAKWNDGTKTRVVVWLEEKPEGGARYGYEREG